VRRAYEGGFELIAKQFLRKIDLIEADLSGARQSCR
jgi:hypothetical protein